MKSFKEFFTEAVLNEMKKKKKKKKEAIPARGADFGTVGAGKSGLMQVDTKEFSKKKNRKQGKDQARNAMRGEY